MAPQPTGKKISKEEELLLQFSKNVSKKNSALFYGNAAIVSALPIWLFWRVQQLDPMSNLPVYVVVTVLATWLMAFAYQKVHFVLKHKFAQKRESAVTKEVNHEMGDKKISKDERDERVLWKKNEVAQYEASNFSIFYNNAIFLAMVIFFGFYFFKNFSPSINYVISVAGSAAVVAFLSTGSK